jgi:hypothetical protein
LITILNNMADLYEKSGKADEAKAFAERAAKIASGK